VFVLTFGGWGWPHLFIIYSGEVCYVRTCAGNWVCYRFVQLTLYLQPSYLDR
jgi:hypothetical protein